MNFLRNRKVKNTIIYAVIFFLAFVGTTAGVYLLNNNYVNMFEFDFRDPAVVEAALIKAAIADSIAFSMTDSLAVSDSLLVVDNNNEPKGQQIKEELKHTKGELSKVEQELSKKEKQIEQLTNQLEQKQNSEHEKWLKSTIKLYEAMETNIAGKLLSSLPDAEARELLYSIKKKKAAEILSSLDTETVKRLTRSKK